VVAGCGPLWFAPFVVILPVLSLPKEAHDPKTPSYTPAKDLAVAAFLPIAREAFAFAFRPWLSS
jgi:hypothetical protein